MLLGIIKAGRVLVVIFEALTEKHVYYPITSYESRKARRIYRQEKGGEAA